MWRLFPGGCVVLRRVLIISLFASALLLVLAVSPPETTRAAPVRGDTDCSGATDGNDALDILLSVAGEPDRQASNCGSIGVTAVNGMVGDTNCDGSVDLR